MNFSQKRSRICLIHEAVFDNSGRYIAVTTFMPYEGTKTGGSIDFWRIAGDYFDPNGLN